MRRSLAENAALLGLALTLAVTACGGDDDGGGGGEGERADRRTTTTAEPESTTTTVAAEGPEEWVEVVRDIEERRMALVREPDQEAITDLYSETCPCWTAETDPMRELADLGHHLEGQTRTVLHVWHWSTDESGYVDLTAQLQPYPLREVDDAEGTLVQELETRGEPFCVQYTLRNDGPEGSYRVYEAVKLSGCPQEGR